jgi:hypothetical protein
LYIFLIRNVHHGPNAGLRRIAAQGVQVAVRGRVKISINPEQIAGIAFPLRLGKPLTIVAETACARVSPSSSIMKLM